MLRRLLVGLLLGLVVGGLVAAGFVEGLHILTFGEGAGGAIFAYLAAAVTGVLTGLVAGKPIWAADAKIEAGLKAFFGALIAGGLMFALRQWGGGVPVPVTEFTPGGAAAGSLPVVSLPLVAALLGGFFELDNTPSGDKDQKGDKGGKKRVATEPAAARGKARVAADDDGADGEAAGSAPGKRAGR